MTINERVRKIRTELKMSQAAFGKKIAVAQSYMASIENGQRDVTPKIFKLICNEYSVNEKWLEAGEGEMFRSEGTLLELLGSKINELDELDRKILVEYLKLSPSHRKIMKNYLQKIF